MDMKTLIDEEVQALATMREFMADPVSTDKFINATKALDTLEDRLRMSAHVIDCLVELGIKTERKA